MKVPLTVNDFLRRAELVYPDRIAIVDEPDQPAESWGEITYRDMATRARAMAAGLDELGIAVGERVAIVSQNSARLLTALFGVSGSGRVLVPVNFRLVAEEVSYIVAHSGARVLLVDPELDEALADVACEHKLIIGAETDATIMKFGVEPEPWDGDEDATATINYTSGTTARPKGVQLTHRNIWLNASVFGWHLGIDDRDVYLHTLPQFHCNGWGVLYAATGMGAKQVIIRKIDGMEILRRVDEQWPAGKKKPKKWKKYEGHYKKLSGLMAAPAEEASVAEETAEEKPELFTAEFYGFDGLRQVIDHVSRHSGGGDEA